MRNKYTASILALLFGWLGFHRFYLGNYIIGVLYILFMFTFIPFLLSLVEFIYFLTINKKEFDIKYNAEYIRNKATLDNLEYNK